MTKKINRRRKKVLDYTNKIIKILSKESDKSFNYKQVAASLEVNDTQSRNEIIKELKLLKSKGTIEEIAPGKYQFVAKNNYIEGKIDMTSRKTAYLVSDDLEEDAFIPTNNLNKALDGDIVKAYIYNKRKGKKAEAEVVEIIKRHKNQFVGVIDIQKNFAFVTTADTKMYTDIFIPKNKIGEAKQGDVVVAEIDNWPEKADSPFGFIVKVLGKQGEHNTEIHAILAEYGLPSEFPEEVEQFANDLDVSINEEEVARRRDMRDALTFTIDPKDAKDFDDALSFTVLENGHYEIGIHIADVSHYVKEGTVLDDEAYERATSIYLVDRTIPMLPEVLSNFACSLRPHEDKFTFSAVFELNDKAELINQWFGRTVTHSDQRMAYEEAQYIIEEESPHIPAEISLTGEEQTITPEVTTAVLTMNKLAKILRSKRMDAGAISFDKVEVRFKLDEKDEPTGVYFKQSKEANHLIEEFMLLTNRKVSEFIGKQKKTYIYRVHDEPDETKLLSLQTVIKKFGHSLNLKSKEGISNSLNQLLKDVVGKKEQNLVDTLAIRSMSKASYSTSNIGHYGLAFDYYSHFTSPIRRYPDVIAHRLLQYYLDKGNSVKVEDYEQKCKHCSSMEILAATAERDSIKYMQVKYMSNHMEKEFLGVVSGVTEWGIYVEIVENKCEGMVRVRDIKDDYYVFDEEQYAMVGQSSQNIIQLGDEVIISVKNADLVKKQLDLNYLGKKQ